MRSRIFVQTRRYVLVAVVLLAISWCGYWFGTLSVQPERRNDMEYRYQMQNKLQDDNARDDLFELPEVQPDHNKQASSNNGHIANKENVMMAQKHDAPEWENVENIIEVNREDLQKSNQIVKGPAQVYKQSARHNSHYTLIHSGSASLIHGDVHKDIPSFSDHIDPRTYMFTTDHLPQDPRHRPSIANGQLGTVVHSREIFMNGVYSGKLNKTHRAVIPSTVSMNITGTEPATKFTRTYVLNVAQGIYSETSVSKTYTLAHRIYAHRNMTQLLVVEVDLIRSEVTDDLTFNVDLNKFGPSFDLTFHQYDSGIPEVSYKFGRGNSAEIPGTEPCVVHVYYDHIPQMLRPTRGTARTKWVFLSSFATTKDEARDAYLKGAALVQANDALYSQHVHSWFSLWQAGRIDILGNRKLAKAVYGSWFYILSSLPLKQNMNNTFIGLSPSGLPLGDIAKDYQGHVFWDQEVWMYPPILLHHFNLAELILTTRNRTLNQAHMNALENHHRGLQYPWESALSGIEVCRGRKYSLREVHVTADISIAILQHLYATRNRSKLADSRYVDLLVGIAEYWVSRMTLNEKTNLYEVYDVMPPDEHVDHVNNSAYTNAAVQLSLHAADYALSMLDNNEQHKYQHYAQHMYIPYDSGKKYHPEFDGFSYVGKGLLPTGKFVKQADVILLGYPLQREMPEIVRENDLIIYEQLTDPGGPAMSWSMFAIGWLEVNKLEKAEMYFMKNFDNIRNEFQVWTEYSSGNGASNFITGAGGFLQALTSGYAGIRIKYDRLDINPRLPPGGTTALHLIGVDYLGSSIDIFLREDSELVFTLNSGSQDLIVYVYSSEDIYDLKIQQSINVKAEKMCIRLKQDGVPDR